METHTAPLSSPSRSWSLLGSPVGVGFPWFLPFIGPYPERPLTSAPGDAVGTGAAPTPSREVQGPSGPSGKKSHTELWGRKSPEQHAQSQRKQTSSENERGRTAGAGAWFPRTAGKVLECQHSRKVWAEREAWRPISYLQRSTVTSGHKVTPRAGDRLLCGRRRAPGPEETPTPPDRCPSSPGTSLWSST